MKTIEKVINHVLALDPEVSEEFAKLTGKTIEIMFTELQFSLYITPTYQGLQVSNVHTTPSDTTIKGTILALLSSSLHQKILAVQRTEGLEISGNLELAQKFNELMQKFSIDWEELLAKCLGDVTAHQVGNMGRAFLSWGKATHESFVADISEYLQEEVRIIPRPEELQAFYADIDKLRHDTARIEVSINQITTKSKE